MCEGLASSLDEIAFLTTVFLVGLEKGEMFVQFLNPSSQAMTVAGIVRKDCRHLGRTATLNGVSPQVFAVARRSRGINLPCSSAAL